MSKPSAHYSPKLMQNTLRWLALLVVAGLGLLLVVSVLTRVFYPYVQGWRSERIIADLRERERLAKIERKQLESELRRFNGPEGSILAARRKGWIKDGEKVIRYVSREELERRRHQAPPYTGRSLLGDLEQEVKDGLR